jgi:hypothetical protein
MKLRKILDSVAVAYLVYSIPVWLLFISYLTNWWGLDGMFYWTHNLPIYSNEEQALLLIPGGIINFVAVPYTLYKLALRFVFG